MFFRVTDVINSQASWKRTTSTARGYFLNELFINLKINTLSEVIYNYINKMDRFAFQIFLFLGARGTWKTTMNFLE